MVLSLSSANRHLLKSLVAENVKTFKNPNLRCMEVEHVWRMDVQLACGDD